MSSCHQSQLYRLPSPLAKGNIGLARNRDYVIACAAGNRGVRYSGAPATNVALREPTTIWSLPSPPDTEPMTSP